MNSFIGWIGGKRALRNEILQRMPADIGRYIEVFGGAGWVLFGREPSSKVMERRLLPAPKRTGTVMRSSQDSGV